MSGTLVSFEIGFLIGIVMFLICERKGLIQKLPGLTNKIALRNLGSCSWLRTDKYKQSVN